MSIETSDSDIEKGNARLVERSKMLNTEINELEKKLIEVKEKTDKSELEAGSAMIKLDSDISIKEAQLSSFESRIEELKLLQKEVEQNLAELRVKIDEFNPEIEAREFNITSLNSKIADKKQELEVVVADIKNREDRVAEKEKASDERVKEISDREDYLAGKISDNDARIAALDYRESNIAGKEKINSDKALELEKLAGVATAKDKDLAEREQKVVDGKIELDELVRVNTEVREKLWKDLEKYQVSLDEMNTVQEKIIADSKDLASRERDYQAKLADIQVREQVVKTKEKSLQITP